MTHRIGIVGAEAAKFTAETEYLAHGAIYELLMNRAGKHGLHNLRVVSGRCHLGGVDIWAVTLARLLGCEIEEHPPQNFSWSEGYKPRNQLIAKRSDEVICIAVRDYPTAFVGMRFPSCYHCNTEDHVKSGGCWTVKYARRLGKPGQVIIV